MRFALILLPAGGVLRAAEMETDTLRIERVDAGHTHRGRNPFSAVLVK
jgi:hypothetical protein